MIQHLNQLFLPQLKRKLNASFIAWERTGNTYRLKIVVDKKPTYYKLNGDISNVNFETYTALIKTIENERQV